ncbi:prepilin-type N-terminal cleavage/methylation domain-containing protein [Massilia consociata]|uniref:Prepilin-type N-terminal cleavage/methylation domain-containing protein n=1 Tax=Massilia consociata TaxID=760117 RepID=A0ABV6FKH2_9BURK
MTRQSGVTLVEIVVVIVLVGIVAGIASMQLGPTIRGYLMVERRAALTDQAETALRRIVTDVRSAVPNSLRQVSPQCVELVPTVDGGRFRSGPDVENAAAPGAFLDQFAASADFDVLTPFTHPVAANDLVVIGNQNTDDLYQGLTVAAIRSVAATAGATTGEHRITLAVPYLLPQGYTGGRFVVVPGSQPSVSYVCAGAGRDSAGNGTGTLYRITRDALAPAASCPDVALPTAAVLATHVEGCDFRYSPNLGATQESGFLQLQLTLSAGGESVPLTLGAHVDNVP